MHLVVACLRNFLWVELLNLVPTHVFCGLFPGVDGAFISDKWFSYTSHIPQLLMKPTILADPLLVSGK